MAIKLFFAALPLILSVSANVKTYEHELPSGETVVCDCCPPGTHLHAHCTKTRPTECRSCSSGFYTEFWNYIPECLPCDLCSQNQEETQSCTSSQNRTCQCREGYYWHEHFCKKHTVCPAGHGIKTKGTPYRDTECEKCTNGHYADTFSTVGGTLYRDTECEKCTNGLYADTFSTVGDVAAGSTQCIPHTACQAPERLVIHGTNWHDNVCVSCNSITTRGWTMLIKPLLSKLFRKQKQRRLMRINGIVLSRRNVRDHTALQDWVSKASEKQLTDLPAKLRKANLHGLADHVVQKIKRLQEEEKYCSNTIM